jgi:soluble lytic murein transglycosylase-like protein
MGFTYYSGPSSNFPPMSQWKSFEEIFNLNKPQMLATGDTGEDVGRIWNAVLECAKLGVEERVIFAIIMQESTGNVGVQTTYNGDGHATAGLMQCDGSPGFPGQHGLSQDQITSMVRAGTQHFKQNLQQFGDADTADTIYKALRAYNSGSVNASNLSDGLGATASYVSDVANRLCGRLP